MGRGMNSAGSIAITGMGLASSLGPDVRNACAAARAGLSRARALEFQVVNGEDNDLEPVTGHPIATMTEGFEGVGRILRIMQMGLADFEKTLASGRSENSGWFLALPDGGQNRADDHMPHAAAWELDSPRVCAALRRFTDISVIDRNVVLVNDGHASFVRAVHEAMHQLEAGRLDYCVVGAADSLLDTGSLQYLFDQQRLKTSDNAVGMQPGEAGAFFLLEPLPSAKRHDAAILGVIASRSLGFDELHFHSKKPPDGRGLTQVINMLSGESESQGPRWLISDNNGEPYRAIEWGDAWTHIVGDHPDFQTATVSYPALSFGDTRMASGAVALCMALRGFAGGYAPAQQAIILSSSDHGSRGGLLVQAFSS